MTGYRATRATYILAESCGDSRYCPDLMELTLDFSLVEEQGVYHRNWIEYISYQRLLTFNVSYSRIHDAVEMAAFFV
jgi:hypothetical protein